jgi:hypothetical protein
VPDEEDALAANVNGGVALVKLVEQQWGAKSQGHVVVKVVGKLVVVESTVFT